MSDFNDSLKQILSLAFSNKADSQSSSKAILKALSSDNIQILSIKENKLFIDSSNKLDYIYVLINGVTYVVNYTLDGRRIIADTLTEPQIFGLIEAINGADSYRGTVITLSNSVLVKVNKESFLKATGSDIDIAAYIIKYLADFSTRSMKVSSYKAAISPYENLIVYLYNKTLGKNLPYRIKDNKSFIADYLHVDKRTLYRYLNKLSADGIIARERQDIIISESSFKRIEKLFNSINNL